MASAHHCMGNRKGNGGNTDRFSLLGLQNHCRWWLQPWNQRTIASWQLSDDKLSVLKSRDITLLTKVRIVKAMVFPVVRYSCWELDCKEGRTPKNWCLQTVVLEKTSESPFDSKEIKSVNLKGDQPWILTGGTDAEAEAPVFWSSDVNRWLTGKVPDAGKNWGQEKRESEDETAGWHHWCNAHELGQTLGDGEGHGGLASCSPCGHKELDTRLEWLNNNNNLP